MIIRTCPYCGAALDAAERCECTDAAERDRPPDDGKTMAASG